MVQFPLFLLLKLEHSCHFLPLLKYSPSLLLNVLVLLQPSLHEHWPLARLFLDPLQTGHLLVELLLISLAYFQHMILPLPGDVYLLIRPLHLSLQHSHSVPEEYAILLDLRFHFVGPFVGGQGIEVRRVERLVPQHVTLILGHFDANRIEHAVL